MYKNYFFLNRLVIELQQKLINVKLVEAFSQVKDEIILHFESLNDLSLIVNVNPGYPHLLLKNNFSRAKKNSVDFFTDILPSTLLDISIAINDRVLKFKFEKFIIYFMIRGKFTNLILVDFNNNLFPFKDIEDDYINILKNEIPKINFINNFNILGNIAKDDIIKLREDYPIVGKEIIKELNSRSNDSSIGNILSEIGNNNFKVGFNLTENKINIYPSTFISYDYAEYVEFNNIYEALQFFFSKKRYLDKYNFAYKILLNKVEKEIEKTSARLNGLLIKIKNGSKELLYNKIGNLLLINLNLYNYNNEEIKVEDIYNGNQLIRIKLDPKLSLKKNADKYFEKSKNEKISFEVSKELYTKSKLQLEKLKNYFNLITSKPELTILENIMKELKINPDIKKEEKTEVKHKFKHYLIDNKFHLYAGKDSQNNDTLTTQFAKQNDLWFHARSVSGSHVVLKVENSKEIIPKSVIKKAASLAAYHSKAKTAGIVPVSYCQKKYVIKKKGMGVGKVVLLKEEVVHVKPEIPEGCEFILNE